MSAMQLISKTVHVQKSMQIGLNLLCFYFLLQEYEVSTIIFLYFIYKWFPIEELIKKKAGSGCPGCQSDYVLAAQEEAESKALTVCQHLANTLDPPIRLRNVWTVTSGLFPSSTFVIAASLTAFGTILIFGCVEGNWNCHADLCQGSPSFSVKFPYKKSYFHCKYFCCETRGDKECCQGGCAFCLFSQGKLRCRGHKWLLSRWFLRA